MTAGFILRLSPERQQVFEDSLWGQEYFAEPVDEFKHSRNQPLTCFIVDKDSFLTNIGSGKRGVRAGTGMHRLNVKGIYELEKRIHVDKIFPYAANNIKKKLTEKLNHGGLLPPRSFEELIEIVGKLSPDTVPILSRYSTARKKRIQGLSANLKFNLAKQKDAVSTAMSIAGFDREELRGWDVADDGETTSFLDGLEQVRLREDQIVNHDLNVLPGYSALRRTQMESVVFENDKSKLTVVLANRLPLEKQLGVDLIYYNETFSCFLMVQYKAMETETLQDGSNETVFRFPDKQLNEEIDRMDSVISELEKLPPNEDIDGYRLCENPFFLKICPRINFDPDNIGLSKGIYLPLDYWKILAQDDSLKGKRGGRKLTYKNVRRYFDNTDFITIASNGWVGSNIEQSGVLKSAIRSTLQSSKSLVFAINSDKTSKN